MSDRRQYNRRHNQSTPEQSAVEGVLGTLWALFTLPFKNRGGCKKLDAATAALLSSHWSSITEMLNNPLTEAMAISEADKLLDSALQAVQIQGDNMGDRLRAAEARWGRDFNNEVWRAHKLRNQIAHEVGMKLAPGQAAYAIRTFRTALQKLGVPV